MLQSADLDYFPSADHLHASLLNQLDSVSDQKEICAQSWGHLEAFRGIISSKTSSQQPCSLILIYFSHIFQNDKCFLFYNYN